MSHKQRRVFWPVVIVGILSLSAWALISGRPRVLHSYDERKPAEVPRQQRRAQTPAAKTKNSGPGDLFLQPKADRERIEVEPVTLRRTGFEPSAITRPRGSFMLAIDNRSQIPDLDFRLARLNGNQQAAKRMRGRELRWRQLVDLSPGEYVLTEANHPQWRCQIVITAR